MKKENGNGEDEDVNLDLELTKSNPCIGCPVWEDWKFTLPKRDQRIPHPIDGVEQCEICPDR
ncbi:MAG: hypothetical protein GYA31_01410 [Parcubacteria group bacterium]|nr:hypothetical protein [Parcubacteria group bacterium]